MTYKKYISVSITSAPCEVLEEHEDKMETVIRCPNCGQPTKYGGTRMISGHVGCDNLLDDGKTECFFGDLLPRILDYKENNREQYLNGPVYRVELFEKEK